VSDLANRGKPDEITTPDVVCVGTYVRDLRGTGAHPVSPRHRAWTPRAAEDAAREMPNLSLEDALKLVYFYAERDSPKYEPAAIRWLERYLTAGSPSLRELADAASELAALLRYGGLCGFRWPARPRIRPLRRGGDAGWQECSRRGMAAGRARLLAAGSVPSCRARREARTLTSAGVRAGLPHDRRGLPPLRR
jgi:hypothetical protein